MLTPPRAALVLLALIGLALAGCGARPGAAKTPPAGRGVERLVAALRADDPRAAYDLLAADTRAQISFEEFALQWKQSAKERERQAAELEEGLQGNPNLGERAKLVYPDGKSVHLAREGGRWRLESAMVSQTRAGRPRDAVRIFAEALGARNVDNLLRILTARRREALEAQLETFAAGLQKRVDGKLDEIGSDRAELRWDESGMRYKVVLRKEGDEWRVDDIDIRPGPPGEGVEEEETPTTIGDEID
jgi:hypothetical protein